MAAVQQHERRALTQATPSDVSALERQVMALHSLVQVMHWKSWESSPGGRVDARRAILASL
jgi:hypothetical protein